jgi:hypothetical protein
MSALRAVLARRRGLVGFAAGVAVAGLVAGAGAAIAAIPSTATASYTACASKATGAVRVIDYQAGKRCSTRENTISWGKGYRYRGTWSAATAYVALDVVVQSGSSYLAKAASKGKAPATSAASWGVLAAAGARGPQGAKGSARAYALIAPDGTVSRSSGGITVARVGVGIYCVTAAGIDADASVAVVTPDFTNDSTANNLTGYESIVEWSSQRCNDKGFQVWAYVLQNGVGMAHQDTGFVFMVP